MKDLPLPLARYVFAYLISLMFLPLTLPLHAQTEEQEEEAPAEVEELSPFEIVARDDDGWSAGTTLIGTRTRQSIRDMPLSIDAVTPEFLDDVGAYDLDEASNFIAGLETAPQVDSTNDDNRTSYRGMGLGGRENAASSRNFFTWYPRTDTYNVERIDFNKGSNSLMFGDTSPGGLATVYTKRAQNRNFGAIRASYGSYDAYRFTLDVNRKITDNFYVRFNMVQRNQRPYIDFATDELFGYHLAATYKPFKNTIIRAEYEKLEFERQRGNTQIQVNQRAALGRGFSSSSRQVYTSFGEFYDPRTRLFYEPDGQGGFLPPFTIDSNDRRNGATGDDLSLAKNLTQVVRDRSSGDPKFTAGPIPIQVNTRGTQDFVDRPVENYSIWVEQRIGDLFLEASVNRQTQSQIRNDGSYGTTMSMDSDGRYYLDTDIDRKEFGNKLNNVRFTAAYPLKTPWFEQFLVGTWSYMDDLATSFRFRLVNRAKAFDPDTGEYDVTEDLEGSHRLRTRVYFDADNPVPDLRNPELTASLAPDLLPNVPGVIEPLWVAYTTSNKPYTDKRFTQSASLSSSGSYFGGRLVSLLGVRYDAFNLKRYILPTGSREELVAEYGELAWWGQDVYLGSPEEAPDQYEYLPEFDQSDTTYSLGLSYGVLNNLNVYGNYSTSFRWQGTEDFLGRVLGPQKGKTIEFGVKGDALDGRIVATAAVFQVDRENVAFRFSTSNNASELEMLFNDGEILIDQDGTMTYMPAEPGDPGFVEIARGLNQEHRQVTADETSKGFEFTMSTQRIGGFRARLALAYVDIESERDFSDYAAQVELAEARAAARAPIIEANWPNDPNYDPDELPGFEEDLREYLEDAQNVLEFNQGSGLITGTRARPWRFSYVVDYEFPEESFADGLRVLLDGKISDDYLMSTNDGVLWYGGSTHPMNLTFLYATRIFEQETDFTLRFRNITDWSNRDGYKPFSGFVDQFTGEETLRVRNITPSSWELSARVRF